MSLENMKVTALDKENYGIISVSDILDGTASENKEKFDRLPNFIADKHNEIVSFVEDNIYTKEQTNTAINEKVKEIGSADMTKAVYATTTKEGYVDKSIVSDNGIYLNTQLLDVLTGEGENIKFFATDSSTYSAFKKNEIEYAVKQGEENEITLVAGVLYNASIDEGNKTINFTSGGVGLNVTVISQLERPTTPKENTIWISSDLSLNLKTYKIGYDYPLSPIQGDLFFKITSVKAAYVYADKKQQFEISLARCEYWDGTQWVELNFETYANGEWHINNFVIFANGMLDEGFNVTIKNSSTTFAIGALFTAVNNTLTGVVSGTYKNMGSAGLYDLTDWNYIRINLKHTTTASNSRFYATVSDNPKALSTDLMPRFQSQESFTGIGIIDIRDIVGEKYVSLWLWNGSSGVSTNSVEIYSITLE